MYTHLTMVFGQRLVGANDLMKICVHKLIDYVNVVKIISPRRPNDIPNGDHLHKNDKVSYTVCSKLNNVEKRILDVAARIHSNACTERLEQLNSTSEQIMYETQARDCTFS
jgi:hypothetical protein